jgi:hypothetical protein
LQASDESVSVGWLALICAEWDRQSHSPVVAGLIT